jgi:hypothetical protein
MTGRARVNIVAKRRRFPRWVLEQVLVLDGTAIDPIYHRVGDAIYVPDLHRHQWYTRCGHTAGFRACWMRRAHAWKFAEPCRRCFPESHVESEVAF